MLRYQVIPVTELKQNCSLIWCDNTGKAVLVDPGGDIPLLLDALAVQRVELTALWLTHGHFDHAGGAQDLREQFAVPVIGPSLEDEFWLTGIQQYSAMFGLSGLRNVTPDEYLSEGRQLELGDEVLEVITAPGHSPGHLMFFHRRQRLAWVGDVIFAGSIGRTDFPQSDQATLIASITEKLWPLGDDVHLIPGHGPESTIAAERQSNPFVADRVLARGR